MHALHVPIIACKFYSRAWSLRAAGLALDHFFMLDVWFRYLLSVSEGVLSGCAQVQPDERFESPSLGRALFEIYLGEKPVISDAVGRWAEGTKQLLDSENERRSSRKGGSG